MLNGELKKPDLKWTIILVLSSLGIAGAFFSEFWTPSVFLAGYDTYTHDYLMWDWGWKTLLSTHQIPFWNPYLFGGFPFVASFAFCPFYPPAWLSVFFPTSLAITSQYALHIALGSIGFFVFARSMGIFNVSAFVTALLYETGGHVATLAFPGHLAKVQAIAWLPWAMAAGAMLVRTGQWRWTFALGGAWALQLLASHSQIFFATFWLVVLYVACASLGADRRMHFIRRSIIGLIFAGILAFGLSAVQMIPALDMAGKSNRGKGLDIKTAAFGALPVDEIPEILLPSFKGNSTGQMKFRDRTLPYIGSWNAPDGGKGERLVSDYAGIWAFLFALAGGIISSRRIRWYFLSAAICALLVSIGEVTPAFGLFFHVVPGFNRFRSPATFMVVFHFALFSLSALGIDAIIARLRRLSIDGRKRILPSLLLAGVVSAAGFLFIRMRLITTEQSFQMGANSDVQSVLFLVSTKHVLFYLNLGIAVLLLAAILWHRNTAFANSHLRNAGLFAILFLFFSVTVLDSFSHIRHFLPKDETANLRNYLYGHWADTAILRHAGGAILPTLLEPGRELNNRSMMRGIRSIHGYHPVVYGAYEKLVAATGGFQSPELWQHFALNYLVIPEGTDHPRGWITLAEGQGKKVIAREKPIGFAQIPGRIEPLGGDWDDLPLEEWRRILGDMSGNSINRAICGGNYRWVDPTVDFGSGNPIWKVDASMKKPGEIRLKLSAASLDFVKKAVGRKYASGKPDYIPCLVPIPAAEGWRVRIERPDMSRGKRADAPNRVDISSDWPRRANGFFLLVPLEPLPGSETVLFYAARWQRVGAYMTGATICLFISIAVVILVFRRRFRSI